MTTHHAAMKRKIDAAAVAVLLAITAAGYVVGVQPIVARENEIAARRAELEAAKTAAYEATRLLQQVRGRIAAAERMLAENPMRLQPAHRLNARLAEITAAAVRHGLQIDQLGPGRATSSEYYVTVPIRVTGRSSYAGATRFLHEVRAAMPDLAVASMDLTGDPRSSQAEPKFVLSLVWHASPDRSAAAVTRGGTP